MIAYDIQCVNGHSFEGWFEDNKAYQDQKKKKLIACPVCNTTQVSRIPSTFAIKSSPIPKNVSREEENLKRVGKEIVDFVHKNYPWKTGLRQFSIL